MKIRLTRRGAGKATAFAVLLMLIVGASLAYKVFFKRPGEQAIQFIPSDAFVVVTLDTNPSPGQTPIFNRIKKALEQEGLTKRMETAIADTVQKSPVVAQVRPYTSNSFAFTMLNQPGKQSSFDMEPVVLVSITDPAKVQESLDKNGKKQTTDGATVYKFAQDQTFAAVIGNYLVIGPKAADIARIDAVRRGDTQSVASLLEYQEARAALPEDANLMVFLSPTAMKEIQDTTKKSSGLGGYDAMKWMAFSATLRDEGVAFDYRMPMDQAKMPALKHSAEIAALDFGMLKKLPSGAYGLMAMAQPDHYWDSFTEMGKKDPKFGKQMDDGIAEFEKQTGMSVQRDILPGLKGDIWMAVYPDTRGADRGVDGLILIDDSNGADPASLAEKVRTYVTKSSSEKGKQGVTFQSQQKGAATVWSLDEKSTKEMRDGMTGMASSNPFTGHSAPSAGMPLTTEGTPGTQGFPGAQGGPGAPSQIGNDVLKPDYIQSNERPRFGPSPQGNVGGPVQIAQRPEPSPEAKRFAENKTVVYAQIGKAVLIASSQEMLDKALTVYQGQGASLADDAAYAGMRDKLPQGSQSAMMVNLGAIMQALRPTIEKAMKGSDSSFTADDIVNLFGQSAGMVMGGKYDGKTATGTFFMPISYERAIHSMGALMKTIEDAGKPRSNMTWLRRVPEVVSTVNGVRLAAR